MVLLTIQLAFLLTLLFVWTLRLAEKVGMLVAKNLDKETKVESIFELEDTFQNCHFNKGPENFMVENLSIFLVIIVFLIFNMID